MNIRRVTSILVVAALGGACEHPTASDIGQAAPAQPDFTLAQGAPHTTASGIFDQSAITGLDVRSAGPNTILEQTSQGTVTGTLSGSYEDDVRVVIHPNGRFNAKFTIICQCSVGGNEGVLELVASDRGELVSPTLASFAGRAVIVAGSGDLSGLRGVLEIEGTINLLTGLSTYTYSGRVH